MGVKYIVAKAKFTPTQVNDPDSLVDQNQHKHGRAVPQVQRLLVRVSDVEAEIYGGGQDRFDSHSKSDPAKAIAKENENLKRI